MRERKGRDKIRRMKERERLERERMEGTKQMEEAEESTERRP